MLCFRCIYRQNFGDEWKQKTKLLVNIKVTVPCYKENEKTKEFMNKKKLSIIEFQEDNDIDTDEEQLELEIERNNNALLNFMKKVSKTKNYVEKNLMRKRKV